MPCSHYRATKLIALIALNGPLNFDVNLIVISFYTGRTSLVHFWKR